VRDDHGGARDGQHPRRLVHGAARVDHGVRPARLQHRDHGDHDVGRTHARHRDRLPRRETRRDEVAGEPVRPVVELLVGERVGPGDDGRPVRGLPGQASEIVDQRHTAANHTIG
jgi:hypothetical protein